jgi:hypothetical protein
VIRTFRLLILLYPEDYRRAFAAAMVHAFTDAAADRSAEGVLAGCRFVAREYASLIRGAGQEWLAKATAAPFERQMLFRDPSLMRPPGMTRRDWAARL